MEKNGIANPAATPDSDVLEMRKQLMLLQQKLDERIHFEDKMLRKAMRKNVGNLLTLEWVGLGICLAAFTMCVAQVHAFELSAALQIFTGIFMLTMVVVQVWSVWFVTKKRRDVINGNLLRVGERILVYKRVDRWCKRIFIPVVVVWVVMYLHELVLQSPYSTSVAYQIGVYVGGALGGIIGGLIGYAIYRKMMGYVNELQEQIEDLKREG